MQLQKRKPKGSTPIKWGNSSSAEHSGEGNKIHTNMHTYENQTHAHIHNHLVELNKTLNPILEKGRKASSSSTTQWELEAKPTSNLIGSSEHIHTSILNDLDA